LHGGGQEYFHIRESEAVQIGKVKEELMWTGCYDINNFRLSVCLSHWLLKPENFRAS
jgi:hypothetical protein